MTPVNEIAETLGVSHQEAKRLSRLQKLAEELSTHLKWMFEPYFYTARLESGTAHVWASYPGAERHEYYCMCRGCPGVGGQERGKNNEEWMQERFPELLAELEKLAG